MININIIVKSLKSKDPSFQPEFKMAFETNNNEDWITEKTDSSNKSRREHLWLKKVIKK